MRILLGGSPCTYWSIAQKNNRETEASGMGWELFQQYVRAIREAKPKYFVYENNKSMSKNIRASIDEAFGFEAVLINSALVSAQNRQRLYWVGKRNADGTYSKVDVEQPEDRGILLRDILESGMVDKEKSYVLKHQAGNARDYFKKHHTQVAFEPVRVAALRPNGELSTSKSMRIYGVDGKRVTKDNLIEVPLNTTADGKAQCIRSSCYKDGIRNLVGNDVDKRTCVAIPIDIESCKTIEKAIPKLVEKYGTIPEMFNAYNLSEIDRKSPTLSTGSPVTSSCAVTIFDNAQGYSSKNVYEVKDGLICIGGKQYPINLPDGFYIIRKLTVRECMRLQTVPEWYVFPVSDSQAYKMLGNGWTVEVIKHLLSHIPNIQNEEVEVLSMYDGMACGMIALKEMGVNVVKYTAYEIDKYAIKTATYNFPEIIEKGDAFQVRDEGWQP